MSDFGKIQLGNLSTIFVSSYMSTIFVSSYMSKSFVPFICHC